MKNTVAVAALAALVILALAGPAQAQYRREPDWLAIAVNDTQSIVPDLLSDFDRRSCESDFIYGTYSTACDRVWRRRALGYGDRFAFPDYGYRGGLGGYGYFPQGGGRDYRVGSRRYGRRDDVSNRAVRNAVAIGEGVNAAIGLTGVWLNHRDNNRANRLQERQNRLQEVQLQELRHLNVGYAAPQSPELQGVSGIPVLNRTGCDLVLRQADGSLTAVSAGGMVLVANHVGLEAQVLGNSTCSVTGSRTADGGTVILTCQR